jgi:predicted nucleic acid-binding protein
LITAVDTNVLLELLGADQERRQSARDELDAYNAIDDLVICDLVYAELSGRFPSAKELDDFISDAEISILPSNREVLFAAGNAWVAYARNRPLALVCSVCGAETVARCSRCESVLTTRQRVLPDFFIGAHALIHTDQLLTRDKGYFQSYLPELTLV